MKKWKDKNFGKHPSDHGYDADDDFARAMELLNEDENMERYYEKKYSHEKH